MRDEIDNRNIQQLSRAHDEAPPSVRDNNSNPRNWDDGVLDMVLLAMRRAGDEALLDQVTVRLERSFGSTRDIREGAVLANPPTDETAQRLYERGTAFGEGRGQGEPRTYTEQDARLDLAASTALSR